MTAREYDFSGVWLSTYSFVSGLSGEKLETDHYVTLHRRGDHLVIESIPNVKGSYMMGRFTLDGRVATGYYHSENSPKSSHKGAVYNGAAQLMLDVDCKALVGKYVGYGNNMEIKAGDWKIVHVGQHQPADAQQKSDKFKHPAAAHR
jgi:roadblock/LC7 domain-containing protein